MLEKTLLCLILFLSVGFSVHAQTERKTIQRGIINGAAKLLPKPEYPPEARNLCAGGKVEVEALVYLATGEVIEAKALSGDELLRESAEKAARKAKFGIPIITGEININFKGILVYDFAPPKHCIDIKRVVNERAKVLPSPAFPKSCRCSGNVTVQIVIDEIGNVIRAVAISGHPLLRIEAEKAALRAKFSPTNEVGKIRVKAILVYDFYSSGNSKKRRN